MDLTTAKSLKLQLLIIRAQSDDDIAFRELHDRFCGMTLTYMTQVIGMKNADDVQQQLWFKVYQQLAKLSNPYGFKSWLMKIAHNTAMDYLKKENIYVQKTQEKEEESSSQFFDDKEPLCPELLERLHQSLNKLNLHHREVVMLFYWHELSCVEIAKILQSTVGTIKSRLFHARKQLSAVSSDFNQNFNV